MHCKCGTKIPQPRVDLGYKTCVNCSTETKWTAVPLIFHKTGNTTQVIKDPELAADLVYMSSRKGFGVMRGMTGKRAPKKVTKPREKKEIIPAVKSSSIVINRRMPTYHFDEVGKTAVAILEKENLEKAISYVEKALQEQLIYKKQAEQIKQIISLINNNS